MYVIKFTDDGLEDVRRLPKNVRNALKAEMRSKLAVNPTGCGEALQNVLNGWYSYHYRGYRVVYKVFEDLRAVGVVGIGKHDPSLAKDIYRRLEASARQGKLAESVLVALRGFSEGYEGRKRPVRRASSADTPAEAWQD
jgi:mRNA-degrading endonuclease RelE of RelBE toxin-antitoxin system